jgi:hypothetical protein
LHQLIDYHEIRCKVNKYTKEYISSHESTIKEDVLFLLSRFTTKDIIIAFAITLLNLDFLFSGFKQLPLRKNKMIESFSQSIYDCMSIFGHSVKSAKRYLL